MSVETKLPFYLAYPMALSFDDALQSREDLEYMKGMYPDLAKKILPFVEEECERMAYETSVIFDEYPDRLQMHLMGKRIGNKVKKEFGEDFEFPTELIEIMMYHEICERRSERRSRRRYL